MTDSRIASLQQACPGLKLKTDPADLEHYGRDWTRRWTPAPLAIALPATVEEVQAVMRWSAARAWPWCRPAAAPASPVARWPPTASWCSAWNG
jgi:FAD/FMN-containing dehydrogenase